MAPPEKADRMLFRTANTYIYPMPASDATAVRFSPVENVFCGTFELNVEATLVLRTLQSHRLPHGFKGARISRVPATVRSMQRRTSRHTLHGSTHVASSRFRQPYRWSECLAAAVLPLVVARGPRTSKRRASCLPRWRLVRPWRP